MPTPAHRRSRLLISLVRDALALNDAALKEQFEQCRIHTGEVAAKAQLADCWDVLQAATAVQRALGPPGMAPSPEYGAVVLRLATVISKYAAVEMKQGEKKQSVH